MRTAMVKEKTPYGRRMIRCIGEQSNLGSAAAQGGEQGWQWSAVQADHLGIVPARFDTGKGQLHRTHLGQEEQCFWRKMRRQHPPNAVKERISRRQHHRLGTAIGRLELLHHAVQVGVNHQCFP